MIWDDAVGFDVEAVMQNGCLERVGIQEQAQMPGGKVMMDSESGRGTTRLVEILYAH